MTAGKDHFLLLGVYRPGSSAATVPFFDELSAVLEQVCTHRYLIVILGDFNVHADVTDDVNAVHLASLVESFDCVQHVQQLTYKDGNTLDLVITKSETKLSQTHVGDMLSDHAFITFTLNVKKPRVERFWTTSRSWRKFSRTGFEADLKVSQLCTDLHVLQDSLADELAELYDTSMLTLLDKHCPAVKIQRRFGPLTPWFDADCRESRRQSRMLERRYRRTGTDADRLAWIKQLKTMYAVYEEKGHQHWLTKIADSGGNTKKLWHTMHGILG